MKFHAPCLALLCLALVGCKTTTGFSPARPPAGEKVQTPVACAGSSLEQAVIIPAVDEGAGVKAEHAWLRQHYPGYRLDAQSLRFNAGRPYDELKITTADGQSRAVFFDISPFFGKY